MTNGRPLRFLALLLCGWTGARGVALYRAVAGDPARGIVAATRRIEATGLSVVTVASASIPPSRQRSGRLRWPVSGMPIVTTADRLPPPLPSAPPPFAASVAGRVADPPQILQGPPVSPAAIPPPIARGRSRLAGSAWLIARDGSAAGLPGSQLGASQAGARLTYALGDARRVALAARVSAPLSGRGREAALGIDWQPTRLPVHVIAEQRLSLDGGRGGPTLALVGGFGPAEVAPGVRLEGYGQAGAIARDGGEAFADGAIRASHPLAGLGALRIDAGAGMWGGAQRGAARLDVGPSLGATLPLGGRAIRLTADWRQRIAGESRPGSGPAVSIGTNF